LEIVEKAPDRAGIHEIFGMPNRHDEPTFSPPYLPFFENCL
jgi:hypothetical protein